MLRYCYRHLENFLGTEEVVGVGVCPTVVEGGLEVAVIMEEVEDMGIRGGVVEGEIKIKMRPMIIKALVVYIPNGKDMVDFFIFFFFFLER